MPSYICSRCGFKTSQRANFKRHLTRKNLCDPINTDTPIKSIAESYGIEIPTTENIGVIREVIRITLSGGLSDPDNFGTEQIYKCRYCNKEFNKL